MYNASTLIDPWIQASLQAELSEALKDPTLRPLLTKGAALLPRFSHYYARLSRLPRRIRRAVQRQWRHSLPALALLLALGQAPLALAVTIPVNGSSCTLINAITAANTDSAVGGCRAGSGADTLQLIPKSVHTLTKSNNTSYSLGNGLPVITSDITIVGHNSTIRRADGAPGFRIFRVGTDGDLTLREIRVSGGFVEGQTFAATGGGIFVEHGTLTLSNSVISGNVGGGVTTHGGTVRSFANSSISNNVGDGVFAYDGGSLQLVNSTISDNQGGGVRLFLYSNASLFGSTISGNEDGLSVRYGSVSMTNCTVSGNDGIGVRAEDGSAWLDNTTVSGNDIGISVDEWGGNVFVNRSLVTGNTRLEVDDILYGEVIANNFNLFGHNGLTNSQAFGSIFSSPPGHGFTPGPNDITATSDGTRPTALNRILNPTLTRNGVTTRSHNLVLSSPAVDAVATGCPAIDQRGAIRPQGKACDIGAVELVLCQGQAATLVGTTANNILRGSPRRDVIHGLGGNDQIYGLGGNDVLCGGTGNDILNGENGFDTCNGGLGTDTATNCEDTANIP